MQIVNKQFRTGTFIDSDDPAFEGLQKMYNSSNVSNTDQDESDGNDDNDDHGDLPLNDDSAGIGSDDIWVASVYESATESHFNEGITAIAAINIRAHQVWIASIETDRLRQGMKDHLDIIKVCFSVSLLFSRDSYKMILRFSH